MIERARVRRGSGVGRTVPITKDLYDYCMNNRAFFVFGSGFGIGSAFGEWAGYLWMTGLLPWLWLWLWRDSRAKFIGT